MKFTKQTFEGENVLLDGHDFIDCTFTKCHIQYSGVMGCRLGGNSFNECTWGFTGPASNTVTFMSAIYNGVGGEGKKMIEATFESIRSGKVAAPKH